MDFPRFQAMVSTMTTHSDRVQPGAVRSVVLSIVCDHALDILGAARMAAFPPGAPQSASSQPRHTSSKNPAMGT